MGNPPNQFARERFVAAKHRSYAATPSASIVVALGAGEHIRQQFQLYLRAPGHSIRTDGPYPVHDDSIMMRRINRLQGRGATRARSRSDRPSTQLYRADLMTLVGKIGITAGTLDGYDCLARTAEQADTWSDL